MITFKEFTFEAAHQLPPYSDLHGHTFKVEVSFAGEPDPVFGWSANLDELDEVIDDIKAQIDHKFLNRVAGLEIPSLENVARWLWTRIDTQIGNVCRVVVRRGADGHAEGCVYEGQRRRDPAQRDLFEAVS
jgi:6-pyruvoyltetrahydropterin/6-carboxytetrahydropterin synthase